MDSSTGAYTKITTTSIYYTLPGNKVPSRCPWPVNKFIHTLGPALDPALDQVLDPVWVPILDTILDPVLDPAPALDPALDVLGLILDPVLDPVLRSKLDPILVLDPALDPALDAQVKLEARKVTQLRCRNRNTQLKLQKHRAFETKQ